MATTSVDQASQTPILQKKRPKPWAAVVVSIAVLGIGLYVVGSSTAGGAGMYNYTLAQLTAPGADVQGRDIKVAAKVKAGSVRGEPSSASFRFDLEDGQGHHLTVAYPRLLPDPFAEGRDAIVQGRLQDGVLQATSLTVKCPSRYGDASSMSAADQKKYYETEYKKHQQAQPKAVAP